MMIEDKAGTTGEMAAVLSGAAVAYEGMMQAQPWLRTTCWNGFNLGRELGHIADDLKAFGSHRVDVEGHAERLEALDRAGELVRSLADEVEVAERQVRRTVARPVGLEVRVLELPEWQPSEEEPEPLVEASRWYGPDFGGMRLVAIPGDGDNIEVAFPLDVAMGSAALERLVAEDERLNGSLVAEMRRQAREHEPVAESDRTQRITDLIARRSRFDEMHYAEQYFVQSNRAIRRAVG